MPSFNNAAKLPNSNNDLPNLPPSDFDSLFFLPTSPQMSYGSQAAGQAPQPELLQQRKPENLYNALNAINNQTGMSSQRVFEMASSPNLSPILPARMQSPRFLMRSSINSPPFLTNSLDAFLPGGLQLMPSPRSSSTTDSPRLMLSPGSRVTKMPVRAHRSPNWDNSSYNKKAPMILPCQIVDARTNTLGLQPGCPDLLLNHQNHNDSIFSSPTNSAACSSPPGHSARSAPLFSALLPDNVSVDVGHWLADFAAHRAAFLEDFVKLDFANVTVIEMKGLLRKYGLARIGKKVELEDRIKQVARFLENQIAKEKELKDGKSSDTLSSEADMERQVSSNACDASIYINA